MPGLIKNLENRWPDTRSLLSARAWRSWLLVPFLLACGAAAAPSDTAGLLDSWLAAQTNVHSWTAEFTQTRKLKALTQPLVTTGHVWFVEPNRFRWEIGQPAQTIAVRAPDQMLIVYPRLKLAEHYSLTGNQPGPWREALALFEAGFPRKRADIEDRFKILSLTATNDTVQITLQPKSQAARRMMPQLQIVFGTSDLSLRATQLQFADGSEMRNEFKKPEINPSIDEGLFSPKIPEDYKITEPLGK